jgi:DNA-binding NtrC family response regulator
MDEPTRILIVEDDRTFRETVVEILRDEGYKVKGARSVNKAAKRLSKHQFDIVLSDIEVGKHSGYELIQIAAETRPNAKIVLMSRHVGSEVLQSAINEGAIRVLPKPFGVLELLTTIRDLFGQDAATQ